jgi:hypothetical protein
MKKWLAIIASLIFLGVAGMAGITRYNANKTEQEAARLLDAWKRAARIHDTYRNNTAISVTAIATIEELRRAPDEAIASIENLIQLEKSRKSHLPEF